MTDRGRTIGIGGVVFIEDGARGLFVVTELFRWSAMDKKVT
jgi:hypothetical protein